MTKNRQNESPSNSQNVTNMINLSNNQINTQNLGITEENEESGFDFMKLITLLLSNWYWIVLSTCLCVGIAWVYLHFQTPTYSASMKILIREKERGGMSRYGVDVSQMGGFSFNSEGFDNELETIMSKSIAVRTVKSLKLYASYSMKGRFRTKDLYKQSPVLVELEESRIDQLDSVINISINPAGKEFDIDWYVGADPEHAAHNHQRIASLPASVPTKFGQLLFTANPGHILSYPVDVTLRPLLGTANSYRARMAAVPTSQTTTVALLKLIDSNPTRALDYLRELVDSYNAAANEEKNEVALLSEEFINQRLQIIQGELDSAELDLQKYKEVNDLINLKNDATAALASSGDYQERQVKMQTEMTLLRALTEYVENPANAYKVIPNNIGLSSSDANTLIGKYNELVLQRQRLLSNSHESQPVVMDLTLQIDNMLVGVKQMLKAQYEAFVIQKKDIDKQFALFSGRVKSTPGQERAINNFTRQQEVKAGLYLMLLQKREENAISLAATAAKARVIDAPEFQGQVSPNPTTIWMIAIAVGILLPVAIIYLGELLRFKIEDQRDVERLTRLPIVGTLPLSLVLKNNKERALVVSENTNNMMEEAFRGLRTNLKFVLKADLGQNVIMVTSVVPGEGKTFVSTNLAMSYALLGKKVILLGLDVRKPRLARLFGLSDTHRGITSFLITDGSDTGVLEEQIFKGVVNENLDVLPAGALPPNPGELIAQDSLRIAIEYLSKKYDIVILDTPPVGLVSDAFDMSHLAHATLVVCRSEVSVRSSVKWIDQIAKEGKIPQANIVLNGLNINKKGYGYGRSKYSSYSKYGYYGSYGTYGTYGNYGDQGGDEETGKRRKKK